MKQIGLYIISCFLLVNTLVSFPQKQSSIPFQDFPLEVTNKYKKVWMEELSNSLGTYYFYDLKKPQIVQFYPIKGTFRVNPDGKLYGFTLSENYNINGSMIPKGSHYQRYEDDDYFISLSKDTTIKGFPIYHKEDGFIFWTENNVYFYNDGSIKSLGLSEDMVINGIPCNGNKNSRRIILFKNGELRHCHLSKNIEIQGYSCNGGDKNSELWFKHNGEVLSFLLSKDYTINGKLYKQGTQIIFNKDGKVHYLSGHLKYLSFYENDNVHNIVLKDDLKVDGISFSKDSRLIYDKKGVLISTRPKKDIIIDGIPCKKKKWVNFYSNGKIKDCILSTDLITNGNVHKKGTQLKFDDCGNILMQ